MNVIPYSRRVYKRSRTGRRNPRMAVQRISRPLRYNGENKITRVITANRNFVTSGLGIGASQYEAWNIVFDPTGLTFYGTSVNFTGYTLPNSAELAALYDQMSIDKVEMTWSSSYQAGSSGFSNASAGAPKFIVCNDSNDGIGSTTNGQIQQQPNKSFYSVDGAEHKWTCYPKFQKLIYQTALVSNYAPSRGFVNSDAAIPHYGIKMGITNLTTMPQVSGWVDFSFKYFITLKNVK